jgi:hypothetical protein
MRNNTPVVPSAVPEKTSALLLPLPFGLDTSTIS